MLNRGCAYTTIISAKYHGTNPALPLGKPLPTLNATSLATNLNNREVTVNGITATGSESLTLGQTLVWNRPPWIEPDSPQHFEVLFNDPHLLGVNKPRGLPTLPAAALWKTPSCGWCKSKPRTQTLSTGWAEPLPASSSSPNTAGGL